MSGETEKAESGWTTDTLRYYFQRQFDDLRTLLDERYATQTKALEVSFAAAEKAVQAALQAAERAVEKAEVAAEKRFDAVNEFRGQLSDQAATFLPRSEAEVQMSALEKDVSANALRIERIESRGAGGNDQRTESRAALTILLGLFGALMTLATIGVAIYAIAKP